MIPLRDVIPSRTTAWVTLALIGLNAAVFIWGLTLGEAEYESLLLGFGLTPAEFSWTTLVTSMFLHSGWIHLGSNLLSLWIFGDNVEDRLGHGRYLLFYLLMGAAAAAAEVWAHPASTIPLVGASGAIAGVMGAYLVMFPHSRILVLVVFFLFIDVVEIPAAIFLGLWFLFQILSGVSRATVDVATGGIAFWAHAGGFAAGLAGVWLFRRPERERADWWAGSD